MTKQNALEKILSYFKESGLVKYRCENHIHYFVFFKHNDDYWSREFKYAKYLDSADGWFQIEYHRFQLSKFELMLLDTVVNQHKKHSSYI